VIIGSRLSREISQLGGLVSDKSNNHAVEVEEEHDEVETQLEERLLFLVNTALSHVYVAYLLMDVELAEDFSRIEEMSVVNDLLDVPAKERQVENKRHPVAVDEEKEGQETMHSSLGDDVGVKSVAEINGVNVVTFQIAVHNRKEDLQKEVHGVDKHRQQKQPSFSGHHDGLKCVAAFERW
jgi:hypothetical protein